MKKIAVMQPYLFPYIGYFQLVNAVDTFIFYDDVNFIKRGWINRNNILVNNQKILVSLPCIKPSQNKEIREVELNSEAETFLKLLKTIEMAYKKAPYFKETFELIKLVFDKNHRNIGNLAADSVREISLYLELNTSFKYSSIEHSESKNMNKAERLIHICKKEKSEHYINAIGGQEIYNKDYFKNKEVRLDFLKPTISEYKQFGNEFVPYLSIIDVLMFNSKEVVLKMINKYKLV
jgi:hypothetical protein